MKNKIREALHNGSESGHSGVIVTTKRIEARFFRPSLKQDVATWVKDVATWVRECDVCQRNKAEHIPTPGLLQPIPIPNEA